MTSAPFSLTTTPSSNISLLGSDEQPATTASYTFIVRLSLRLQLSVTEFNSTLQQLFREQIAVTAGLPKSSAASAVNLTIQSVSNRRSGIINVNVSISMPNAAAAQAAVTSLTESAISLAFNAVGLPSVSIISPPTIQAISNSIIASIATIGNKTNTTAAPSLFSNAPHRLPLLGLAVSVAATVTLLHIPERA